MWGWEGRCGNAILRPRRHGASVCGPLRRREMSSRGLSGVLSRFGHGVRKEPRTKPSRTRDNPKKIESPPGFEEHAGNQNYDSANNEQVHWIRETRNEWVRESWYERGRSLGCETKAPPPRPALTGLAVHILKIYPIFMLSSIIICIFITWRFKQ